MPRDLLLGDRVGPFEGRIDADYVRQYARATSDDNPLYQDGFAVPPVALATLIFDAQLAGMEALIPQNIRDSALSGVHGEHDVLLYRPIVAGEPLVTFVEAHNARPYKTNLRLTLRHSTYDGAGLLVAEQWWTTVYIGTTCPPAGTDTPEHTFPEEARNHPADEATVYIDSEMAQRYAEVSGDFSAHHFDVEAAQRSGFDSVFLHGLCTMGLCAQAAVRTVAEGDPRRVRRVAVRFASPAFPDNELKVQFYAAGANAFAFEATCAGAKVISHGRVELSPA